MSALLLIPASPVCVLANIGAEERHARKDAAIAAEQQRREQLYSRFHSFDFVPNPSKGERTAYLQCTWAAWSGGPESQTWAGWPVYSEEVRCDSRRPELPAYSKEESRAAWKTGDSPTQQHAEIQFRRMLHLRCGFNKLLNSQQENAGFRQALLIWPREYQYVSTRLSDSEELTEFSVRVDPTSGKANAQLKLYAIDESREFEAFGKGNCQIAKQN